MHEYVQKSYSTTLPFKSAGVSGGELIQPLASSAGTGLPTGRCFTLTGGPLTDEGFECAAKTTALTASAITTAATPRYPRRRGVPVLAARRVRSGGAVAVTGPSVRVSTRSIGSRARVAGA